MLFQENTYCFFFFFQVNRIVWPCTYIFSKERKDGKYVTLVNSDYGKGGELFYQIAKRLSQIQFLCAGLGAEIIPQNIEINKKLKTLKNVTILERTDNMAEIYEKTRLLLIPSLVDETFSMVALEAMSNGIPIIASPNGNLPFLIENGGILLDTGNIDSWIDAIIYLITNKVSYNELSENAQKIALKYNPEEELNKFLSMIKTALGEVN